MYIYMCVCVEYMTYVYIYIHMGREDEAYMFWRRWGLAWYFPFWGLTLGWDSGELPSRDDVYTEVWWVKYMEQACVKGRIWEVNSLLAQHTWENTRRFSTFSLSYDNTWSLGSDLWGETNLTVRKKTANGVARSGRMWSRRNMGCHDFSEMVDKQLRISAEGRYIKRSWNCCEPKRWCLT